MSDLFEELEHLLPRVHRALQDVSEAIATHRCVREPFGCGRQLVIAIEFRDRESRKEYAMSALCQRCQDAAFNEEDV